MNLGKTEMLVMGGTEGEISESKVDPCGVCGKRVMTNVLCTNCNKWIHGICSKVKRARVTPKAD